MVNIQETYSSALVNYTEPRNIGGVEYTRIYTELNTDLNVGDYIYILNGNYDNSDLININEYQDGSTGYKILEIENNAITIDILFKNEKVWNEDSLEDYTKVYVVNDLDKFNYENIDNNFGFKLFGGDKYSIYNNNIFLSQIENLPYTAQVGTKDRFFKSDFEKGPTLKMVETRGQLIDDQTELKFDLDEMDIYGITDPNGASGSTYPKFNNGIYIRDFIIMDNINVLNGTPVQYVAALNSSANTNQDVNLWTWDKRSLDSNSKQEANIKNSGAIKTNANILRPFSDTSENITIKFPSNFNDPYYYRLSSKSTDILVSNTSIELSGINETIIVGYNDGDESMGNRFRGFGFYNSSGTYSKQFPSPDIGTGIVDWNSMNSFGSGYRDGGDAIPYLLLSSYTSSYMGPPGPPQFSEYTGEHYMPIKQSGSGAEGFLVPPYGRYVGIGKAVQIETNTWNNNSDRSKNFEIALAGAGEEHPEYASKYGGIHFYSYTGNWQDYNNTNRIYAGNGFSLSKLIFDKYNDPFGMSWLPSQFNPFINYPQYPFTGINDIKWVGTEKKELGMGITYDTDVGVIYNPSSPSSGIFYSKYLVICNSNKSYYIYLNFNSKLLMLNPVFDQEVRNLNIPQVHIVIEELGTFNIPTVIGSRRKYDKHTYPSILDGDYPIGSLNGSGNTNFGIPNNFTGFDFSTLKISSFDYSDNRWLVSSSAYSPRISSGGGSNNGLYVYDRSVDNTTWEFRILNSTDFDIGDDLPSNSIFKTLGEVLPNGKRRVWAGTSKGLFYFDYELDYFFEYYYKINFDDNDIPLDDSLYTNDRIFIVEDFTYDGFDFKKGIIYKYLKNEKRWTEDSTYNKSYLTKAHFKDGSFQKQGIFNDGLFGNKYTNANWSVGKWRNGIVYNSIWKKGTMESKSDTLMSKSYYSKVENNTINISTDFNNNDSYGYNSMILSTLLTGTIDNCNILKSTIGLTSSDLLLDTTYKGLTYSFNDIDIKKSYISNSSIYSIELNNSKINNSKINNSIIGGLSKMLNNNTYDSIIKNGIIENQGDIKITGYDRWYNLRNGVGGQDVIQIHKFYVKDTDFIKLNFEDWIVFNDVKINNSDPSNILDKLFYILGGEDGYYGDSYENLNKIKNGQEYQEYPFKTFISRKINTQNTNKSVISFNGTQLEVTSVKNSNPRYSIDLAIVTETIPYGSDDNTYIKSLEDNGILKFNVTDTTNSTIQNRHFRNSWINGGEWLNGSMINPNQLINKFNYGTISSTASGISFDLYEDKYEIKSNRIIGNEIVHINNIWDTSFTTDSSGQFKIVSGTSSRVLSPYGSFAHNSTLTPPMSQYTSLNINRIDGIDNSLIIRSGMFKNQSFSNVLFKNDDIELDNFEFNNIRNLMIINSEITKKDNVKLDGIFLGYGHISNDFTNGNIDINVLGYKQTFTDVNVNSGLISKSAMISGVWNKGQFKTNKHLNANDLIPINNRTYGVSKSAVATGWHTGTFNNGTIEDSIWMTGTFSNGKFVNSDWLDGVWLNGTFGDISSRTALNTFRKGHWLDGAFENGVFGDDNTQVKDVTTVYTNNDNVNIANLYTKGGTNIWENGNFNNGIFSSTNNHPSLWMNGKFNNGSVIGSTIWYDGIFNNGKFNSKYGRHTGNVVGQHNILTNVSAFPIITDPDGSIGLNFKARTGKLPFLNRYNISSVRDLDINIINNPGTLILDTSDFQLKFMFITNDIIDIKTPFIDNISAHGYTEKAIDTFYNNPSTSDLYLQFRPLDYEKGNKKRRHPLHDSNILGSKIFIQNTSNEYIFDGTQYIPQSAFLGATISGTSLTYSSIYPWRNGVFNNGKFGSPENSDNSNPSWENGTFNGGNFNGKLWKTGTLVRGDFNGSGVKQQQTDINNIFKGYEPQKTMEQYQTDYSNIIIATSSPAQIGYKTIQDNYRWYGLWLDGKVSPNINSVNTSVMKKSNNITPNLSPSLVSALGGDTTNNGLKQTSNRFSNDSVNENQLIEYFNEDKYSRRVQIRPNFNNMVWVKGDFNNTSGNFNESVWLSGTFRNGNFNNSIFNPYVQRWDFEKGDMKTKNFTFELDTTKSIWKNGNFNSGVFYYSDWENGTFNHGTMVGGLFKKGVNNYMSAYSTIWEAGRFRNGNWYGSNFAINNVYNESQTPNPFEYLGSYFENTEYAPFVTDILGNNSKRSQDDRLHIWNTNEGTIDNTAYDLTDHDFGQDNVDSSFQFYDMQAQGSDFGYSNIYLKDLRTNPSSGVYNMQYKIKGYPNFYPPSDAIFNITDKTRYEPGFYEINFETTNGKWNIKPELTEFKLELFANIYEDGILIEGNVLLKTIPTGSYIDVRKTFEVLENQEYGLRLKLTTKYVPASSPKTYETTQNFYMTVTSIVANVNYTSDNNTLNGYVEHNWSDSYLNSDIISTTLSSTYDNNIQVTQTIDYITYDLVTISVPTKFKSVSGANTQYGNGSFYRGIFENGIWNNGYRGTEYGLIIADSNFIGATDIFTYSNGTGSGSGSGKTASVEMNQMYIDNHKYKYRTEPVIFFNNIQRSFRTRDNTIWRFVLQSALDIDGTDATDIYNKLIVGDQVSVSNIIAIDINGNRKLIKDVFSVVAIPTRNQIILEYKETFPIDNIQIDSDRHLIGVTKNIWLNGAFLNGYFQGNMIGGVIRGNREVTMLEDSHLTDVSFDGGQFKSVKYPISYSFDNKTSGVQGLSPQFIAKYKNLYHSGLIQNMDFKDGVTMTEYDLEAGKGVKISGVGGSKNVTVTNGTSSQTAIQYIYNTDMNVVYEPEYFSSLFNQNIVTSHMLNNSKIDEYFPTAIYNIPAGYITYDILSSVCDFKYSAQPSKINEVKYKINLGSKYKIYNDISIIDFDKSPGGNIEIDKPSAFNIVQSATYGIYVKKDNNDGISFDIGESQFIHESFIYDYATSDPKIKMFSGDNSFKIRDRYHLVEVDVEFKHNDNTYLNPYDITKAIILDTSYTYSISSLPKLSIGQNYNEFYETSNSTGYLSPYDNDMIGFINGNKESEINNFGVDKDRLTLKSFIYNNFGGYRDSVKMIEKDFDLDTGATSSQYTINSPIYYSFKHFEIDKIPFFNYRDYNDPITGSASEWNVRNNQVDSRRLDDRIKVPFYATSVPIDYTDSNFVLTDNINFLGGTNLTGNSVIQDVDTLRKQASPFNPGGAGGGGTFDPGGALSGI